MNSVRWLLWCGSLALLSIGTLARWLEVDMARHMALQFPLLIVLGAAAAEGLPRTWQRYYAQVDAIGLTSLTIACGVLALWMIPAALDATQFDARIDTYKVLSLLLSGAALTLGLPRAPPALRLFSFGMTAWMWGAYGVYLLDTPTRVCLVYLSSSQQHAALALIAAAIVLGGWSAWPLFVTSRVKNS
jgi:hypothetical protein